MRTFQISHLPFGRSRFILRGIIPLSSSVNAISSFVCSCSTLIIGGAPSYNCLMRSLNKRVNSNLVIIGFVKRSASLTALYSSIGGSSNSSYRISSVSSSSDDSISYIHSSSPRLSLSSFSLSTSSSSLVLSISSSSTSSSSIISSSKSSISLELFFGGIYYNIIYIYIYIVIYSFFNKK